MASEAVETNKIVSSKLQKRVFDEEEPKPEQLKYKLIPQTLVSEPIQTMKVKKHNLVSQAGNPKLEQ